MTERYDPSSSKLPEASEFSGRKALNRREFHFGPENTEHIIKPDEHRAIQIKPEHFQVGAIEFGFNGEPVDVIVAADFSGVSNGGPVTQTRQGAECAQILTANHLKQPVVLIGQRNHESGFAKGNFTGELPTLLAEVQPANTIPDRFKVAEEAATQAMQTLIDQGYKRILFFSNGYTAFPPFAIKKALEHTGASDLGIRAKLLMYDSSYPDTSMQTIYTAHDSHYPVDRFNLDAYRSTENLDVYFGLCNFIEVSVDAMKARAPEGTVSFSTSLPYSRDYVERWERFQEISKEEARIMVTDRLEGLTECYRELLMKPETIFLPLLASSGYWDKSNTGKWMSGRQYQDVLDGSRTILHSAEQLAKMTKRPVLLSGVEPFINLAKEYARQDGLSSHVFDADIIDPNDLSPGVYLGKVPLFPQDLYGYYLKAADVNLSRSSQTNTDGEAIAAGAPILIVTFPDHDYMNADYMDEEWKRNGGYGFRYDDSSLKIAEKIKRIVEKPKERQAYTLRQKKLFDRVFHDSGYNFQDIMAHLAGIRS